MPAITDGRITFLPLDRSAISEQSPNITPAAYTAIFNAAANEGETTNYFKFLSEIAEKDPDILHSLETRTSYVTSKQWYVEGPEARAAEKLTEYIKNISGDPSEGLLSTDGLINSMLGPSYLVGIKLAEIVTDDESIVGFNPIPPQFLTFNGAVNYPKLWTQKNPMGVDFNKNKMISHYLNPGQEDPARGWLGNCVSWLYVLKRTSLEAKLKFQKKYGRGFLLCNMPGDKDSYAQAWQNAEDLIENYSDVDGAVFPADVQVDFKETAGTLNGQYFFDVEDSIKKSIVQVILGQDSTSSSESSNRSTAEVHMEVLEQRIIDDISAIETTLTDQLVDRVNKLPGFNFPGKYQFKFEQSDIEQTLDEDQESPEEKTEVSEESEDV